MGPAGPQPSSIGRRLREIRLWRGLSLRATAELAGFSASYLSLIERGQRPVDRRSTLEALAAALRVAPSELGSSFPPVTRSDDQYTAARLLLPAVEEALTDVEVGERAFRPAPWPDIDARLAALYAARHSGDYARQAELLPGLIVDLNGLVDGEHRVPALQALVEVYQRAATTSKTLGVRGLPAFAALRARQAADQLGDPAWQALAAVTTASTGSRSRAVVVSDRAIDALAGTIDDVRCREMAGALHLGAGLAEAALGRPDRALERLGEAGRLADGLADGLGFGGMLFGPTNVRVWRLATAVEIGEGGRVRELAAGWDVRAIPSSGRHADYWAELGRGLATAKGTYEDAVAAFVRAEALAPHRIRAHPLIRETVIGLLPRVARERSAGRDLRGLAWRMGIAA